MPRKYDDRFDFIPDANFEQVQERFKDYFTMKRRNGILEVRMHEKGLPDTTATWSFEIHRALPQMFQAVGADRDNEVLILTGTGDYWLREFNRESFSKQEDEEEVFKNTVYDNWFLDGSRLQEYILNLDIPTISVINGPGFHSEFALMADLTLCSEDTRFMEPHLAIGLVPGDGQTLVFQQLLGLKRANWLAYTCQPISAQTALEWGLVNEVLPRNQLLPRAWQLAEEIMKQDRVTRAMTVQILRRPWKRMFTDDFMMHYFAQMFGINVQVRRPKHNEGGIEHVVDEKGVLKQHA